MSFCLFHRTSISKAWSSLKCKCKDVCCSWCSYRAYCGFVKDRRKVHELFCFPKQDYNSDLQGISNPILKHVAPNSQLTPFGHKTKPS